MCIIVDKKKKHVILILLDFRENVYCSRVKMFYGHPCNTIRRNCIQGDIYFFFYKPGSENFFETIVCEFIISIFLRSSLIIIYLYTRRFLKFDEYFPSYKHSRQVFLNRLCSTSSDNYVSSLLLSQTI